MKSIARPSSARSSPSSSSTAACTETSSAEVISSQMSSSGSRGERPRDRDALPLAARELAPGSGRRARAGSRTRSSSRVTSCSASAAREVTQQPRRAGDRDPTCGAWVERVVRVLEDDLDPAALLARPVAGRRRQRRAAQQDRARGRRVQADDAARDRRLAAARLADQRDALAGDRARTTRRGPRPPCSMHALVCTAAQFARPRAAARPPAADAAGRSADRASGAGVACPVEAAHGLAGADRSSGGISVAHLSIRWAQRGAKAQPVGRSPTPTATPGMPSAAAARRGRDRLDQSPRCRGVAAARALRPPVLPRRFGRRTSRRCVGDRRDHREVVRDVDRRRFPSRCSRPISSRMRACVTTSSPVVGSSRTTSGGSQASAIAIATRCCWPPESWCGKRRVKLLVAGGRLDALERAGDDLAVLAARVVFASISRI